MSLPSLISTWYPPSTHWTSCLSWSVSMKSSLTQWVKLQLWSLEPVLLLKELSYLSMNVIHESMKVVYAEANPGNSDNQSLIFIEDDNTQHSSSMMFASPYSLISHLSTFWKSRNYPLTGSSFPGSSWDHRQKSLDCKQIHCPQSNAHWCQTHHHSCCQADRCHNIGCMPESRDQTHPLTSDRWVNSKNVNLSASANKSQSFIKVHRSIFACVWMMISKLFLEKIETFTDLSSFSVTQRF